MDSKKIMTLAAAAVLGITAVSGCSKSEKSEKTADAPVPIVEEDPTEVPETTEVPTEVMSYPDYPVEIPEIKKQSTGDLYEAEAVKLPEGLKVASDKENFSGEGYVTGFSSQGASALAFSVNVPSNQHYDLSFNIASDKETRCRLLLNGNQLTEFTTSGDGRFTQITVYGVFLTKGGSNITLCTTDSDICLDYLKLSDSKALSELSYEADGEPVNKNSVEAARDLLSFLTDSYGKYIITGQYAADEDNSELDLIYRTTGKYPVIRFCNLKVPRGSYDESFKDIDACADWYRDGGIVGASWYWSSPSEKSSIKAEESDFDLSKAVTDKDIANLTQEEIRGLYGEGNISEQCYDLILDIDNMAGQLTSLKNKGVPVLWRPVPEGYGDWYWWGASGAESYKWLWKLIYTRMTEFFELDNLIWVWNGQSESTLVDKNTYDIAAVDLYMSGQHDYGDKYYESFAAVQKFAGKDKLIAISECGSLPDIDSAFRDNAIWSFFGLWFGEYVEDAQGNWSGKYTSEDTLIRTYNSEGALTLDEYRLLCEGKDIPMTTTAAVTEPQTTAAETTETETDSAGQ